MSKKDKHIAIVGAGVIGAMAGYYLSKAGMKVTILDKGKFGAACSHANCGYICPSHVLPLATPDAMSLAFPALFKSNYPLKIRPGFNFARWSWLRKFASKCNEHDMMRAGKGIQALLNLSRGLFGELIREESIQCEWQEKGLVFVFQTEKAFKHYAETDDLLKTNFKLKAAAWSKEELLEAEPALKPDSVSGAYYYKADAHLRPDKLMAELKRLLTEDGVKILENREVTGIEGDGSEAVSITTTSGQIKADGFIIATGAETPFLAKHLGSKIPIQPGKGLSITMPRPKICPKYPLIFEEHRVAVTPFKSGYRLGSLMEIAGYTTNIEPKRVELLKEAAKIYLKEPLASPVQEEWFGWRPMTYDSLPIIDRSVAYRNVWIAAGHNMLGLSMATGTGKLLSEMLLGEERSIDMSPYSVKRF